MNLLRKVASGQWPEKTWPKSGVGTAHQDRLGSLSHQMRGHEGLTGFSIVLEEPKEHE